MPTTADETFLIASESGEILRTFDKPFEKNYSFKNRDTQLTPDMLIRFCDFSINDYDMREQKGIVFRAELKREEEAGNRL